MTWRALGLGKNDGWTEGYNLVFPPVTEWLAGRPEVSYWVNAALIALTALMMIGANRRFNLLRTMSVYFAAFFVLATCATPSIACSLSGSALLAFGVVACMSLMFSVYAERISSRRVFLCFAILSAGTFVDYAFALYIPVFIVALGQMKLFRFKKLLAMLVGLCVPPWIIYGLGIASYPRLPEFYFTPPTLLLQAGENGGWPFLATVAFTMFTGSALGLINIFKILGFNARARAFNGVLTTVGILTGIMAIVNFTHLHFYVMLLNASVAFQVGLFFRFWSSRRGYVVILILMAAYVALYLWQMA